MKDDKNSENSQSGNKSVNNQNSENFEDYLLPNYKLSQDLPGIGLTINDQFL